MWNCINLLVVDSTNDYIKSLPADSVVVAKMQTKSRGRLGRTWISMEGNLFCSLKMQASISDAPKISLLTSLAVLNTIKQISSGTNVRLKWPNDVLIDGQKVAGILIERFEDSFIIGVGVNISDSPDVTDHFSATDLAKHGIKTNATEFLSLFLQKFDGLKTYDFEKIKQLWLENAYGLNTEISIKTADNLYEGTFISIGKNAELLLQTNNKIQAFYAGDVFFNKGK